MFSEDLHLCLLKQGGRLALLKFAVAMLTKRRLGSSLAEFMAVSNVELRGSNVAVQVDGDTWGELPVQLEAVPPAVTMVLPARQ